jgi:hypothetical protein
METPRAPGGAVRAARWCLLAAAGVLLAALCAAPKPWELPGGPGLFATRPHGAKLALALWWAGALNVFLCCALAATAGLWARPLPALEPPRAARPPRGFLALLVVAVLVAGALRWPLAHSGLWHDEAWSVRHVIAGDVRPAKHDAGALRVRVTRWSDVLWNYSKPVNHPLYSASARLSLGAWRRAAGRAPPAFDEFALRLPAWLAAMASVLVLGLLLGDWGFPRAGVAAAWLLALHPWHVRYGADGRGYSFVVLFCLLATCALGRALRGGGWRAWLAYAAAVFALGWTHSFAAYFVLSLAAAALVAALAAPRGLRAPRAARVVAVHALAAMCVLQVIAPNLQQAAAFAEGADRLIGRASSPVNADTLAHQWALTATGVDTTEPDVPERRPGAYPTLADWRRERPWTLPVVFGVLPLVAAVGLARLVRRGGVERWLALGLAGGVPVALAIDALERGVWYPRFGIYGLPAVAIFAALGAEALLLLACRRWPRARRTATAGGLALLLVGFQALVAPETRVLLERPHAPSREVVQLLRDGLGADGDTAVRAVFGMIAGDILLTAYEPRLRVAEDAAELAALAAEAGAAGRPLYVAYGRPASNRKRQRDAMRWLGDPAYFEEVALFDAIEVEQILRVVRWTGRPLEAPSQESVAPSAQR